MLLENKVAVIYGAGGPIGGAVARAFAREGARFFWPGARWRSSNGWPTRSARGMARRKLPSSMRWMKAGLTRMSMGWRSRWGASISRST